MLELYICGTGGQGIQLMAKTVALAAIAEDMHVLLAAEYGFTMRGGSSHASISIGTDELNALPVLGSADAAIVLHHQFLEAPLARLRTGALVLTDSGLVGKLPPLPGQTVETIAAAAIAQEIGSPITAGLAMLASFCTMTGLVRNSSLITAMESLVPSYRWQHVEANRRALLFGADRTVVRHPIDLSPSRTRAAA